MNGWLLLPAIALAGCGAAVAPSEAGRSGVAAQGLASPADVRVVTYNTANGNPNIKTPQEKFTRIPFYREALTNAPGAPILCLQEVGNPQRALVERLQAAGGPFAAHALRITDHQSLMVVVPGRYAVVDHAPGRYLRAKLEALPTAVWKQVTDADDKGTWWREIKHDRGFQALRLKDGTTGKAFTLINTHLALPNPVALDEARQLFGVARQALRHGPVVVAGDLNTRTAATDPDGKDADIRKQFGDFADAGPGDGPTRRSSSGDIDWVLVKGFRVVSARVHRGASLGPEFPDAAQVSDHFAEDDGLAFD